MKKTFVITVLSLMALTVAFAEPMAMLGKIKSVTMGQNGAKSQIAIVDSLGKVSNLTLSATTMITDKSGQKLTVDKLAQGEQVSAKVDATQDAVSIQVQS